MNAPRPKLDVDTTRERLVALGCGYAAEQLDHVLREAVRTEVPAHAFLETLLQAELSGREARRVKTSLRLSNLPVGQTLENFDFAFQPAIERSRSTRWPPVLGCATRRPFWSKDRPGSARPTCWSVSAFGPWSRGSRCSISASMSC